jgi:hypothetical protein
MRICEKVMNKNKIAGSLAVATLLTLFTLLPARAEESIRGVDFNNFTYQLEEDSIY